MEAPGNFTMLAVEVKTTRNKKYYASTHDKEQAKRHLDFWNNTGIPTDYYIYTKVKNKYVREVIPVYDFNAKYGSGN
jgi:Holliday junction resolvase